MQTLWAPETPEVDVLFIHGLQGDPIRTWSQGDVCWPRDILPLDVMNARVMTWGYDSSIANISGTSSQASLFGHADGLLSDLSRSRRTGNAVGLYEVVSYSILKHVS